MAREIAEIKMPVDQVLDIVASRLETNCRDPKVGRDLASEVRSFNKQYAKAIEAVRKCEDIHDNLNKIVLAAIPQGKRLADNIWQTLESYGQWSAETSAISDLATKVLGSSDYFVADVIDAILNCKKE